MGRPLPQYWEPRRVRAREVREMIERLDPVEHAVEIAHLSQEVLVPPLVAYIGYAAGFARTLANPAIAHRIYRGGTGRQIVESARRDLDTLTFFGLFMREGYDSPTAQAIYDRVQNIHREVKGIGNDLQLEVLGLLIFDQERADEQFGLGLFTERDKQARFTFWLGVATAMKLTDVPQTREEFLAWLERFEQRRFAPSMEGHESFKGLLRGLADNHPRWMRPFVRHLLIEAVRPDVREILGFSHVPGRLAVAKVVAKAWVWADRLRGLRLDRSWVEFSRFGDRPDIHAMGLQTPVADAQA